MLVLLALLTMSPQAGAQEAWPLEPGWVGRSFHATTVFNDRVWLLGGTGHNDVWSSADGAHWEQATAAAPWWPKRGLAALAFDGKLWVLGGDNEAVMLNDVWSSVDGANWEPVNLVAPWPGRAFHGAVVFDGKMWVFGGRGNAGLLNDVWWSEDGANWTQATAEAPWAKRWSMGSASFQDKLWLFGGINWSGISTDSLTESMFPEVWSTVDGASWNLETDAAEFRQLQPNVALFNNALYVTGFLTTAPYFGVWHSLDGIEWSRITDDSVPAKPFVYAPGLLSFAGGLLSVGGFLDLCVIACPEPWSIFDFRYGFNNVWGSVDGVNWIEGGAPLFNPARHTTDIDFDGAVSLGELLRVVQFFNSGGYRCAPAEVESEDGYLPGPGDYASCRAYSPDYNPQDGAVSLNELLRVIQLFNIGGYDWCPDAEPATEDGFCVAVE
jgi:hypothetical protein